MLLAAFAIPDPDSPRSSHVPRKNMASPFLAINSMEPEELGDLTGKGASSWNPLYSLAKDGGDEVRWTRYMMRC